MSAGSFVGQSLGAGSGAMEALMYTELAECAQK